jgi:hypothetical protein
MKILLDLHYKNLGWQKKIHIKRTELKNETLFIYSIIINTVDLNILLRTN